MRELLETIQAWQAEGAALGRAVVVRTFGSAPRPEGATLVVTGDGRLAGSVSGGCVEGAAFEEIQAARAAGVSRVIRYGISDEQAWDVGLACGGTIDVLVEPYLRPEVVEAAGGSTGSVVVIPLPADAPEAAFGPHPPGAGAPPSGSLRVTGDGTLVGSTGLAGSGRGDRPGGPPAAAARGIRDDHDRRAAVLPRGLPGHAAPCHRRGRPGRDAPRADRARARVRDGRRRRARVLRDTPERFPDVDRLVVGWPDEVADEIGLGPADAVAVLTHDVKFDEPAIVEGLRRGCRYVGAVGSKKTQADRRARLRAAGVTDAELARLCGPIGLDLGGRAPAETALAIMAEVVAERYGGSGAPMHTLAPTPALAPA